MRVIIDGWAGSGKSTVARAVAERFKLRHVSAGDKFRVVARRLGFSTNGEGFLEFSEYQRTHPSVDKAIDELIIKDLRRGNCVVDSRIAGRLFKGRAYRVLLRVPDLVAAERNALREGVSKAEALRAVVKRNKADIARYEQLYGIDFSDLSVYDLVLDTSHFSIKDMNAVVLFVLSKALGE